MSTVESYNEGAPCWIDLVTTDIDAARAFYGGLFGWSYDGYPMPSSTGETMTYYMGTLGGRNVAGLMQSPAGVSDQAPLWQTYFAVDDADAAAARVTAAGGTVLFPVDEIPGSGRMTIALDPQGAKFGLWQTTGHIGTAVAVEPGAPIWHELQSDDAAASATFYSAALGVLPQVSEISDLGYTELLAAGRSSAGIMPKQSADQPDSWLVYFGVDSPDESAAKAVELGGSVAEPPFDIDGVGRMAVLTDPQGIVFAVMRGVG